MNRLPGIITAVITSDHVSLVDVTVGEDLFSAIVVETPATAPYLEMGRSVWLLFKETEVSLAKRLSGGISLSNRIPATVRAVRRGGLLSEVQLDYRGHGLVSVITTRSAERLELRPGDRVEGLVKSNEMILMDAADAV